MKERVEREAWRIVELIIRQYPGKKKEYEQYMTTIMTSSSSEEPSVNEDADYSKPQSTTEAKALKMTSAYADRLKKQIEAIEFVYGNLNPEEQKVIRIRFWSDQKRKIPYLKMKSVSYSERQMKRIVYKTILQVGRYLGEIK